MNVYEAVATSPIGAAMHERGSAVAEKASWLKPWDEQYPDGWQPLAALEDAEQWKQRAEKAEAEFNQLNERLRDITDLPALTTDQRDELHDYINYYFRRGIKGEWQEHAEAIAALLKRVAELETELQNSDTWKERERAELAEAQLYEACRQLAGEYTLGEPLTELIPEQHYIAIRKSDGRIEQGTWRKHQYNVSGCMWTYYADPRPWPVLPEKKPRYKVERFGWHVCVMRDGDLYATLNNQSDAEGLAILLNESEAKNDN